MSMNRIVFFSGGKSSFAVAAFVKENYPEDNIVLYFTDTLWEDDDLYRFIIEASDKLGLPLLIHSRGITPAQLMVMQRFMANSRVGTCSKKLKMDVSSDFLKKGVKPSIEKWYNLHFLKDEDFTSNAILYFGIGFFEMHREKAIRRNWEPFNVEMPLITNDIDVDQVLEKYRIRQPRLYDMQFSHNNCKGRCVKGGQGHFKNLLVKDKKTFISLMEQEIVISFYIRYFKQKTGDDYLFNDVWNFISTGRKSGKIEHIVKTNKYTKNWFFGGRNRPFTFMKKLSLEELEKTPVQLDLFDIGGCGCFTDYQEVQIA